jgi:hypothetical protein
MSRENVELAQAGIATVNDAYRTGDVLPWKRHVEKAFDPNVVLEARTNAFTEWRGHDGVARTYRGRDERARSRGKSRDR